MYFQNIAGLFSAKIIIPNYQLPKLSQFVQRSNMTELLIGNQVTDTSASWCEGLVMDRLVVLCRLLLCTKYQHKSVYH